ncbi:helix-turn-helix transcriptional regulator [Streptomyces griseoluteus]|uniref:helix-turn-helix transcriptional regulator n=1 Tax=Streptomyces griseoluteus TaxID=29306 RepID=UPI003322428A
MSADQQQLLTPRQVEAEYGFSRQTLANWRHQGTGPAYMKSGPSRSSRVRYRRSAIEAWLNARTVTPESATA